MEYSAQGGRVGARVKQTAKGGTGATMKQGAKKAEVVP